MRKASTALLEPGTQTPSPAPDLIPAENLTRNSHSDWYNKRGHVSMENILERLFWAKSLHWDRLHYSQ